MSAFDRTKFYIGGEWIDPVEPRPLSVINPSTEKEIGRISLGSSADVDRAVAAARGAFPSYSRSSREDRIELLQNIVTSYRKRQEEVAQAISMEMGAPISLSRRAQAVSAVNHFLHMIEVLKEFRFEERRKSTYLVWEPIGVAGLITPWNWPVNQIACKAAPALAAGCTMVLKPSEIAPLNAALFADILHDAGVPKGVFNLVNGDGPGVGTAISLHKDIDVVSFTGSTRAGVAVAQAAAATVKRVHQELGGKSANIILEDADLAKSVKWGVETIMRNSGQSCNAPTRMLVPRKLQDEAMRIAHSIAEELRVGDASDASSDLGPVVSETQFTKIQSFIKSGIEQGATIVAGGTGRPAGLEHGYFVRPTVFANVTPDMEIAREEIFGPVLSIIPYDTEEEAIEIANDTVYGLSGYVSSGKIENARRVASQLRVGNVHLDGAGIDVSAPFGGFKQSGNGREYGEWGLAEFLEIKAMMGYEAT